MDVCKCQVGQHDDHMDVFCQNGDVQLINDSVLDKTAHMLEPLANI